MMTYEDGPYDPGVCLWTAVMGPQTWKSSCSLVPFVHGAELGIACPYCGGLLRFEPSEQQKALASTNDGGGEHG